MPPRIPNPLNRGGRGGRPLDGLPPERREGIAMWGAPTSGKSTFGAALAVALEQHQTEPWRLRGIDTRSGDELGKLQSKLVHLGEFPTASQNPAEYNWQLVRPDPKAGKRFLYVFPRRDKTERIPLRLRDGPGRFQNPDLWLETAGARGLVETMTLSAGFIFLYDPVAERVQGDAYQHTSALLARIDQRLGGGTGGYLPQYLAVCVAKFDDDRVYRSALAAHVVDHDYASDGRPYVDDDGAEAFFVRMCRASPNPAAQDLPQKLRRYFHPDRIRFFVTSAIGFYRQPSTGRFDPGDPRNVIVEPGEKPRIRSTIRPINVMEPVLWLAGNLKGSQE